VPDRDPRTGQFVAETDSISEQTAAYSDLDVQTVRFGTVAGDNSARSASAGAVDPVGEGRLDNDEVAQLVRMERYFTIEITDTVDVGVPNHSIGGKAELQINAFPDGGTNPQFITSDTHFGINGVAEEKTNQAILDVCIAGGGAAVVFDGTATVGGGGGFSEERVENWAENMKYGPWLDVNDQLDCRVEVEVRSDDINAVTDVVYQLYWDVHQVAGGRPSFAAPSRY